MARIELTGCTSEPLLHYLKALGVLRLVAEQADPAARGYWILGTFILDTHLETEDVVGFFLETYEPTPLVACWNGASGFFPNDPKAGIEAIMNSTAPRLRIYRQVISKARSILEDLGVHSKPGRSRKPSILLALRASLPDEAVPWLDAAYVLTEEEPRYPPLLGVGAIDGHLEFSNNFMQRLCDVLPELGANPSSSRQWLEGALFGVIDAPLLKASVGQYLPGGWGPNATQGIEADSLVNPWDYVLGLEGTLLLAGGVARRYSVDLSPGNSRPAFPFTVQASAVGYATASASEYDEGASRAEIWLPEWPRPASYREVAQLLSEGRATWGGRQARTGADFARAVISLGVDRGISGFRRFGFLQRSGRAYLAAPLGYLAVQSRGQEPSLLEDLDTAGWLERFRRAATRARAPAAARRALQSIEGAILRYAASPPDSDQRTRALQDVLVALWQGEMVIARSRQFRTDEGLSPFPGVSRAWLPGLDDGSDEFRVAAALASIGSGYRREQGGRRVGPFRMHWEPVRYEDRYRVVWDERSTCVVGQAPSLGRRLLDVLHRRVVESLAMDLPNPDIDGYRRCNIDTIAAYLSGSLDEKRTASLIGAFTLIRWDNDPVPPKPEIGQRRRSRPLPSHLIPWAFAVIKMLFWPWPIDKNAAPAPKKRDARSLPDETDRDQDQLIPIRAEPAPLVRLRGDDVIGAVQVALQRLRAAGLSPPQPRMEEVRDSGGLASRIGGALLIPTEDVAALWERAGLPEVSYESE